MPSNVVFAAVSNPERRRILDMLRESEMTAGGLGAALPGLAQPAVSRHLRALREAGLVSVSPMGQQRVYAPAPGGLKELDA
ncbi:MAG: winged helix-turn-helix transcriptional regulator [Nitrososphaerota archaeon]|jgi:DNA-binding transcriptional ArsR family regulator|nr:metalloregulator ArsR/SmtB family transcription factor [Nitrososphaerota archaeon]MCL5672067.1 metalloregulator ArsR/SmtB family transcription factor [Nitrososphaerota archaeon]MDG6903654.1 winged helix-turn-helix transcriptional regulator [Nitrososphaerota archaeon]MDG6911954.1 winged helix-turn-helix transcriptional regulator [Nitrososphaerota archaeon]MDG6924503.1 winged helix-turn-helix transcriptional regulator [Nitrososphaerota archaeon]